MSLLDRLLNSPIGPGLRDIEILGRGGVGIVYKAYQVELERVVAIKLLNAAHSKEHADRLIREARCLSLLNHPNIVRVFACGKTAAAEPYIVMEYVEGETISDHVLSAGPLSIELAKKYFLEILQGLHAMHKCGLLHRDLNPANFMITKNGALKILDFGFVKNQYDDSKEGKITRTRQVCGTVAYASPESCLGAGVDVRSDIYALGCLLYFMVAGRAPFQRNSIDECIADHLSQTPEPIHRLRQECVFYPGLEETISKCMAKRPDDRFQHVTEIFEKLDQWNETLPISDIAYKRKSLRFHLFVGLGIVPLLLAGVLLTCSFVHPNILDELELQLARRQVQQLKASSHNESVVANFGAQFRLANLLVRRTVLLGPAATKKDFEESWRACRDLFSLCPSLSDSRACLDLASKQIFSNPELKSARRDRIVEVQYLTVTGLARNNLVDALALYRELGRGWDDRNRLRLITELLPIAGKVKDMNLVHQIDNIMDGLDSKDDKLCDDRCRAYLQLGEIDSNNALRYLKACSNLLSRQTVHDYATRADFLVKLSQRYEQVDQPREVLSNAGGAIAILDKHGQQGTEEYLHAMTLRQRANSRLLRYEASCECGLLAAKGFYDRGNDTRALFQISQLLIDCSHLSQDKKNRFNWLQVGVPDLLSAISRRQKNDGRDYPRAWGMVAAAYSNLKLFGSSIKYRMYALALYGTNSESRNQLHDVSGIIQDSIHLRPRERLHILESDVSHALEAIALSSRDEQWWNLYASLIVVCGTAAAECGDRNLSEAIVEHASNLPQTVGMQPESFALLVACAQASLAGRHYERARDRALKACDILLKQIISSDKVELVDHLGSLNELVITLLDLGLTTQCEAVLRAILDEGNVPEANVAVVGTQLESLLNACHKQKESTQLMLWLVSRFGHNSTLLFSLVEELTKSGDFEQRNEFLKRLVAQIERSDWEPEKAHAYRRLGGMISWSGNPEWSKDLGLEYLRKGDSLMRKSKTSMSPNLACDFAETYLGLHDYAKAVEALRYARILIGNDGDVDNLMRILEIYAEIHELPESEQKFLRHELGRVEGILCRRANPEHQIRRLHRFGAIVARQSPSRALDFFARALEICPTAYVLEGERDVCYTIIYWRPTNYRYSARWRKLVDRIARRYSTHSMLCNYDHIPMTYQSLRELGRLEHQFNHPSICKSLNERIRDLDHYHPERSGG